MRFEANVGVGSTGSDHIGSKREVWHEVAIHHVELDAIDTSFAEFATLVSKVRKVGWQNGGDNFDPASHAQNDRALSCERVDKH